MSHKTYIDYINVYIQKIRYEKEVKEVTDAMIVETMEEPKPKTIKTNTLYFVTGNSSKFKEASTIFENSNCKLVQCNIDLPEYQGTPEEVVYQKAMTARSLIDPSCYPFIIEDTSLAFNCLNGMPGVYIRDFYRSLKCEGLYKLTLPFNDYTAQAKCIISLMMEENSDPILFTGVIDGKIVYPRGNSFCWDPIFEPNGFDKTFAELPKEHKNLISHRARAFTQLVEYLKNQ